MKQTFVDVLFIDFFCNMLRNPKCQAWSRKLSTIMVCLYM